MNYRVFLAYMFRTRRLVVVKCLSFLKGRLMKRINILRSRQPASNVTLSQRLNECLEIP